MVERLALADAPTRLPKHGEHVGARVPQFRVGTKRQHRTRLVGPSTHAR